MYLPKVTYICFLFSGIAVGLLVFWMTGELSHGLMSAVLTNLVWHGIVFVRDKLYPTKLTRRV